MRPERDGGERLPPQSREAERAVLGSMLRDDKVIGDIVQVVRADNFYSDAHQKLYQAIVALYDRGHPVELITLAEELRTRGHVEDVGGYGYLAELLDACPTAANGEYYARIVRDRALVRNLIHAGTEILRDAYDDALPADELLGQAEKRILEVASRNLLGQTYTLEQALTDAYAQIDSRYTGDHSNQSGLATGYNDLDEITAGLQKRELIIVAARPSVGKCLARDAEIVLDDGSVVTIEEVYRRRRARLLTLRGDWKLAVTEPSAFVDDGLKPVYRVTTRLGRRVETTLSHPFLTVSGWMPLAALRVGERVAVPRCVPIFGSEPMRECEVKLLAYLIGDGCLVHIIPGFTNSNSRVRADFNEAVRQFGGVQVREDDSNGTRTMSVYVSRDRALLADERSAFGARLRGAIKAKGVTARTVAAVVGVSPPLVTLWCQGKCAPDDATFARLCAALQVGPTSLAPNGLTAFRKNDKNALTQWLERIGLWGKGSRDKFVPEAIFRLPREQLALFLNRLFATDGWATVLAEGQTQLGYATVSERLARQIQHLLLRFGVLASLRRRAVKYRGGRREAWQLDVTDQPSIRAFLDEIGIFGKEEATARVAAGLAGKKYQSSRDLVPVAVWEQVNEARGDLSWAAVGRRMGLGERAGLHVGRRAPTRPRLAEIAAALGNEKLRHLAESDVYWDEIVSIEPVGVKQVYDLTIPDTHNFVADDVCVHNTAFALNLIRNISVDHSLPAFFVSLEQSRIELAERLLCCQARVDSHRLRKGTLTQDDMEKLIAAGGALRNAKLFIDDSPTQNMLRIAANARRLKQRENLGLVCIDYLQLIEPDNRRDPRQEQVAQISRRLKALAREIEVPVIALAQVNRASEDRQDHRPRLADLRESGSIEQDSDCVMMLHRPDRYEPGQHEGVVEVIVAKNRNGPVGEVTLAYIKQFMRYENVAVGSQFD
jgi:replicative DNA helicase